MAALAIGAELDLVDSEELTGRSSGIGFKGADKIRGVRRQDLFLARNEGDRARAAQFDDTVIVFPRQEAV